MREALPILAAGSAFAGATLAGLWIGVLVAGRTGQQLWALGGLGLGLAVGAYGAVRLLFRSI